LGFAICIAAGSTSTVRHSFEGNMGVFMRALCFGSAVLAFSMSLAQSSVMLEVQEQNDAGGQSQTKAPDTQQAPSAATGKAKDTPSRPQSPTVEAWQTLEAACSSDKFTERASATLALGLLRNDAKARKLAEKALSDPKPEVRSVGAAALGEMGSRRSIPKLRKVLDDKDPSVALAAAHALHRMHDKSSYEVFYEILTRQRKGGKGLISSSRSTLSDPKKMAQLGFEEGIGFIPFAGIGWRAVKEVRKDDSSPVRAASARVLAEDPDPAITKVLADQAGDKSWIVRAAALEALAKRGDPSVLDTVELYLMDEKDIVRYTAAAATVRLLAIKVARPSADSKDQQTTVQK
jgi:HEAT repeat protein